LAVADVNVVPAGRYAKAALQHFGLWESLKDRLAQADNVRAALAFVARGEAPLGIVYASDAFAETGVRVLSEFPATSHPAIGYPVAPIAGALTADSVSLLVFLKSPDSKRILQRHGFLVAP
jgi:molybdate transport system substrate-binding protein